MEKIHSHSDRMRYIFALLSFCLAAIVVFIGLSAATSSHLGRITGEQAPTLATGETGNQDAVAAQDQNQPLSPVAGIGESFKGIEKVIPQLAASDSNESWEAALMRISGLVIKSVADGIVHLPQTAPKIAAAALGAGGQALMKAEELAAFIRESIYNNFSRGHSD